MSYQDFIQELLRKASLTAKSNYGKVIGETKDADNNQVLTVTDLEIGNLLVSAIGQRFPQHSIIDEEAGVIDKKSELTWVVDPIDGTSNFASGLPMYGIMIGLLENNIPIAGGIALPAFEELYIAEKGKGAYRNGQKIEVTGETNLMKCLVSYAIDGHQENPQLTKEECTVLADILLKIRNLRISNSCFDIMMVAQGKYGAWINRTSRIWDNVAPQIIIEEAGGKYTDFIGNNIDYTNAVSKADKNYTVCAGPPALHCRLQEIINKYAFTC